MSSRLAGCGIALAALAAALPASAIDGQWGELSIKGLSKFTIGAGVRTQGRHIDDLGILNTPGQQTLCQADDCSSFSGDPTHNQKLLDAHGGHFMHANDDGDMNYDAGDFYTGVSKLNTEWTVNWGEWTFKTTFVGYYDPVNTGFTTNRYNTVQCSGPDPSHDCNGANPVTGFDTYTLGPDQRQRSGEIEKRLAVKGEFREYFLTRTFPLGDYEIFASLGSQRLRWGEANLTLLNTLDVINPQDAVLARQPGLALNELNLPVGLLTLGSDVAEGISIDGWLQYEWKPVRPEPAGSLFSTSDVAGGGNYAVIGQGQYPEDPDALWFSQGATGLISNSHRTIYVPHEKTYAPDDFGQYGLRMKWYLPNFNNGTELGFYFANYHSRLPYLSVYASQESCLRDAENFADAAARCQGFNAASNRGQSAPLAPERCDPRGCDMAAYLAREPLPTDTLGLFLDFPENIQMYGVSFNTTFGGWSFAGEYAFRPNLPAQVLISDLVYAGLQPAIGRVDMPFNGLGAFTPDPVNSPQTAARVGELLADFGAAGDPDAANSVLPGARTIFPDYVSVYRGYDNSDPNRDIAGGQYIAGYERLKVGQFALTALQLFSTNPFGSEDLLMVYEIGFTNVFDMPEQGRLYFQGAGDMNHPSPGADCTGGGDPSTGACDTPAVTGRINPTQMKEGFADPFSWGVRTLWQLSYNNLFDIGLNMKPTVLAFWDVKGTSPSPMQYYVEGNKWIVPALFFEYGSDWSASLIYQYFAGPQTLLRDRDNIAASVAYSF
jgi:hypothetical protein